MNATAVRCTLLALLASGALFAGAVRAADPVTDAMQAAYAPYRAALFRTNSGAAAESAQALDVARARWQQIADQFGAKPPLPYEGDAAFAGTLKDVLAVLDQARGQVAGGKLNEAHETLERVRDLLADLRRRNGVTVFSDEMNAYHEAMERVLNDGPAMIAAADGQLQLMASVGALQLLAARLRSEAPARLRGDTEFTPMLSALEASVAALRAAVIANDRDAIRRALGALKQPYSRMFVKFG